MRQRCYNQLLFRAISILPGTLWLSMFSLAPLLIVIIASFCETSEYGNIRWHLSLDNYNSLLHDKTVWAATLRSLTLSSVTTSALLVITFPAALTLAKSARPQVSFFFLLVPFWTNTLLRLHAMFFLARDTGVLNQLLMLSGLRQEPIRIIGTQAGTLIGLLYLYFPLMCLPIYVAALTYDKQYNAVSQDLGATGLITFINIKLPHMKRGIYQGFAATFLLALGDFITPQVLGGNNQLYLSTLIYMRFGGSRNWSGGAALAILLCLVGLSSLMIFRLFTERYLFRDYETI